MSKRGAFYYLTKSLMQKINVQLIVSLADDEGKLIDTNLYTNWFTFGKENQIYNVSNDLKEIVSGYLKSKTTNVSSCHCCLEYPA